MAEYTHVPDLVAEVSIPQGGILSRTIHSDDRMAVTVFGFDAGQELSEHTSTKTAIIEILRGEAEILLGEDRHQAGPGTWVHMPPGTRHAVRAHTPVVMLLILLREAAD